VNNYVRSIRFQFIYREDELSNETTYGESSMESLAVKCRACGSMKVRPYGNAVCGTFALNGDNDRNRRFFKCRSCGSLSVEPLPKIEDLSAYYENYAKSNIGTKTWHKRRVGPVLLSIVNKIGSGQVLDIGCGAGGLLDLLPPHIEKYGVETSESAVAKAMAKGIKVCALPWDLAEFATRFDLIIALDFIEHVTNPAEAIAKMAGLLKPGGYLVIETGNADSLAAKILREDWGYLTVFGHLCALTPKALGSLARNVHIKVLSLIRGNHESASMQYILYRAFLACSFRILKLASSPLKPILGNIESFAQIFKLTPPGALLFDNMILIGRKL
jgi:SAM-dependent methyltransferase